VSFHVTAVVAVATDVEVVQAESELGAEEPQEYKVPEYANEPLISPNATPPVTYKRLQGVTSQPTRARIEESDFCLTEPANESVRTLKEGEPKLALLAGKLIAVTDDWAKELSAFLYDQSPSMPTTQPPNCRR
jgi:hypothetical protein